MTVTTLPSPAIQRVSANSEVSPLGSNSSGFSPLEELAVSMLAVVRLMEQNKEENHTQGINRLTSSCVENLLSKSLANLRAGEQNSTENFLALMQQLAASKKEINALKEQVQALTLRAENAENTIRNFAQNTPNQGVQRR